MRAKQIGPTVAVVRVVTARDQGACVRCGRPVAHLSRGVEWSVHHRRPRGMGGTRIDWVNRPANLLMLCGSGVTGCHGWVEANRDAAYEAGFLVSRIGVATAETTQLQHALHGRILLRNDGGWDPVRGPDEDGGNWWR